MATYCPDFRPSLYTTALLRVIQQHCTGRTLNNVIDLGVGSGVLLAALGRIGAKNLWGVDINPHALIAAEQLLSQHFGHIPRHLLEGDLWAPISSMQHFDIVVANLPHFPAHIEVLNRPKTWSGGDGRKMINRFIEGLSDRLVPDGVAFITHHDLVGLQKTLDCTRSSGLTCETVARWTVFETPERMSAVSKQTIIEGGESLQFLGGYAFMEARILAIKLDTAAPESSVV
jgi:release factor glutamine methyltransferase